MGVLGLPMDTNRLSDMGDSNLYKKIQYGGHKPELPEVTTHTKMVLHIGSTSVA
jgi:hypothetical protein